MSGSVTADLLAQLEAAVADPTKRARLIAAIDTIGGSSKRSRIIKAIGFGLGAIVAFTLGPFGMAGDLTIGGAFAAAALAEIHG